MLTVACRRGPEDAALLSHSSSDEEPLGALFFWLLLFFPLRKFILKHDRAQSDPSPNLRPVT